MSRITVCLSLLLLAACTGARLERTSDAVGGVGPRWGTVSYTGEGLPTARELMTAYCQSASYRVVADDERTEVVWARKSGNDFTQKRIFLRFQCVTTPLADDPQILQFRNVRLPAALRAQQISPEVFAVKLRELQGVPMPELQQDYLLAYVVRQIPDGPEFFIKLVYAPKDYQNYLATLSLDDLARELARMHGRMNADQLIQPEPGVK